MWCYKLADNCGRGPRVISGCDRENLWVCSRRRCESPSEDRSCELVNAKSSGLMSSQPRVLQRPYSEISVVARQLWNRREGTREKNEAVGWGLLRFANCVDVKNLYIYLELQICRHYQCVMSLTMLPITPGLRWTDLLIIIVQTSYKAKCTSVSGMKNAHGKPDYRPPVMRTAHWSMTLKLI